MDTRFRFYCLVFLHSCGVKKRKAVLPAGLLKVASNSTGIKIFSCEG